MKRVVSGMRPTGRLHLGHLVGALQNWEQLQRQYDCFYFVADWHALTSHYASTGQIVEDALDNAADWIGAGLDPDKYVKLDPRFLRPAEVDHLIGDAAKAKQVLGWEPDVDFRQLVTMMVDADLERLSAAPVRPTPVR